MKPHRALAALILTLPLLALEANAASYEDKLLDAIQRHENSARYPYGVRDGRMHTSAQAREIARQTIRNAWLDYLLTPTREDFVDFLGDIYCPKKSDPAGNRNWKRDVKRILKQNP